MQEIANKYLALALEIEAEGKRNVTLGSDADYVKMISLMHQHIELAKILDLKSPFEDQVSNISDLKRRLENYRKTGLFEVTSMNS